MSPLEKMLVPGGPGSPGGPKNPTQNPSCGQIDKKAQIPTVKDEHVPQNFHS